jgi:hypothetical protein
VQQVEGVSPTAGEVTVVETERDERLLVLEQELDQCYVIQDETRELEILEVPKF